MFRPSCGCACGTSLTHLSLLSFLKLTLLCRCRRAESHPLAARRRAPSPQRCLCHLNSLGVVCLLLSRSGQALRPQCVPLQAYLALALLVVQWSPSRRQDIAPSRISALRRHRRVASLPVGGMHSPKSTLVLRRSSRSHA
jgi:hypothetical protein